MPFSTEPLRKPFIETHSWKELVPKYPSFPDSFKIALSFSSSQYITDEDFDSRCSEKIKSLSTRHWTPVAVARLATKFLVSSRRTKVLDIGSGVGKFCITSGAYTNGLFTGVEQRENLCVMADTIAQNYKLTNVKFVHSNITQIDFRDYDAFYFYNSFHENIERYAAIDTKVDLDISLYNLYTKYLCEQLSKMQKGTRLVTYSGDHDVPVDYELLYTDLFGALKFWQKIR